MDTASAARPEPPVDGDELATLVGFLEFHRATLAWKTDDLDAAGLAARSTPSAMTLGGMLKHLTYVEDWWCGRVLHDLPASPPWDTVDWSADEDWDWHSAADDSPAALRDGWRAAVDRSRDHVRRALEDGGLDRLSARAAWRDGRRPSLRWILVHLVEEYARHNGHTDLIREAHDGARSGE